MQTSDSHIYAVGECAEHDGKVYGLVAPLYEQGKVLADYLTGKETKGYKGSTTFTSLKVSGCDLYSAGKLLKMKMSMVWKFLIVSTISTKSVFKSGSSRWCCLVWRH